MGAVVRGPAAVHDRVQLPLQPSPQLKSLVWGLLAEFNFTAAHADRRTDQRYPFPRLIQINPFDARVGIVADEVIVVTGKHLSISGLGFYHPAPITHRLVVASFEQSNDVWVRLLMDLTWCRFTRLGWYESGGKFVRTFDISAHDQVTSIG